MISPPKYAYEAPAVLVDMIDPTIARWATTTFTAIELDAMYRLNDSNWQHYMEDAFNEAMDKPTSATAST